MNSLFILFYFYVQLLNYPLFRSAYGNIKCLPLCAVCISIYLRFSVGGNFSMSEYRIRIKKFRWTFHQIWSTSHSICLFLYNKDHNYAQYSPSVYPFINILQRIIVLLCFVSLFALSELFLIHFQLGIFLWRKKFLLLCFLFHGLFSTQIVRQLQFCVQYFKSLSTSFCGNWKLKSVEASFEKLLNVNGIQVIHNGTPKALLRISFKLLLLKRRTFMRRTRSK